MRLIGWGIAGAVIFGAILVLVLQIVWIGILVGISIVLLSLIGHYWGKVRQGKRDGR